MRYGPGSLDRVAESGVIEPGAPARRPVTPTRIVAVDGATVRERPDRLVTEEPMEIRLQFPGGEPESLAVTMRTPGTTSSARSGSV